MTARVEPARPRPGSRRVRSGWRMRLRRRLRARRTGWPLGRPGRCWSLVTVG